MQFQAGYILEGVREDLSDFNKDKVDGLLMSLSTFDIDTKIDFTHVDTHLYPYLAVLNNIFTRGLPTKPSESIEIFFSEKYAAQRIEVNTSKNLGEIKFVSVNDHAERLKVFDALHVIDPRIRFNKENYNVEILGSNFEKAFIFEYLSKQNLSFLSHVFLPQRNLDSIVPKDEMHKFPKQSVDFAVESPYLNRYTYRKYGHQKYGFRKSIGSVIEIDGQTYHASVAQRLLDDYRDRAVKLSDWETLRLSDLGGNEVMQFLIKENDLTEYLKVLSSNFKKSLSEIAWKEVLEYTLAPFAIARIQKTIIELLLCGKLDWEKDNWKIRVYERDIPCAQLAIKDLQDWIEHLFTLSNVKSKSLPKLPSITLQVISTPEFSNSPLQLSLDVVSEEIDSHDADFDLILDIAILTRSVIERPAAKALNYVNIRSSHFTKSKRRFYTSRFTRYRELGNSINNEQFTENLEAKECLKFFLRNIFRKEDFNPGQLAILNRAIQGKSVIGLLPTGGGKSLTYQLAAMLQAGVTVVIDPIKSLMQDQFEGLVKDGIDGCNYINSKLDTFEKRLAEDQLVNSEVLFTFISPERLQIDSFRKKLLEMHAGRVYFSYCVIDEVHCVSEWGHDFRTSYLSLGANAMEYCRTADYPNTYLPLFGLTATASFDVLADVERELGGYGKSDLDTDAIVRSENTNRVELQYLIVKVDFDYERKKPLTLSFPDGTSITLSSNPIRGSVRNMVGIQKQLALVKLIEDIPALIGGLNSQSEELEHRFNTGTMAVDGVKTRSIRLQKFDEDSFFSGNGLNDQMRFLNGGIVFSPHRGRYFGVTDQFQFQKYSDDARDDAGRILHKIGEFVLNDEGQRIKLPIDERRGVADAIERNYPKFRVGVFMGSSDSDERSAKEIESASFANQELFINSHQNIMVSTKAFGMGINKRNVRYTIHINYPNSIESFVQEAGRAGRDGNLALSTILFHNQWVFHFNKDFLRKAKRELQDEDYKKLKLLQDEQFFEEDLETVFQEIGIGHLLDEKIFRDRRTGFINVDRDLLRDFHSNSFKGAQKEKINIAELLTDISYPDSGYLSELTSTIKENFDLDSLILKVQTRRIYCDARNRQTYGYIDLGNLNFNVEHTDFDRGFSRDLLGAIVDEIKLQFDEWHNQALLVEWLLNGSDNVSTGGILNALSNCTNDGDEVDPRMTVHFRNKLSNDLVYETNLYEVCRDFIDKRVSISGVRSALKKLKKLRSHNFNDFIEYLVEEYSDIQLSDLIDRNLAQCEGVFYRPRVKSDTDKALYRLLSIGVIDDYTVDYNKSSYELVITKKPDGAYRDALFRYIRRYYSIDRAEREILRIDSYAGHTEIEKCIELLVDVVYEVIEKKRIRALDDMIEACAIGVGPDGNQQLKEHIYTYFNSKYARPDFTIDGNLYSLSTATNEGGYFDFEIVLRFMEVIEIDASGPQLDNVKHLRGACMRLLRINSENGALLLLKSFALLVIGIGDNDLLLEEAKFSFIEGLRLFLEMEDDFSVVMLNVNHFKERTLRYSSNPVEAAEIMDLFIEKLYLEYHKKWLRNFNTIYLEGYER